ncbi:MAG: hypothetical protein Q9211_003899 [Gyalolechia sp. 1 TL-2023]
MMQCLDRRFHSTFPFTPAFHGTSRLVEQRQNQLFDKRSSFGFKELAASPNNLEVTPPFGEVMRAATKDTGYRHTKTSQPAVVPGIPEQWYKCLNETGPEPGSVPFGDDDPPFYLHNSASDQRSTFALQAEPSSSHLGHISQPAPLSHSLLSRLELSENDPNTFREVIDDLTVQNQKLKKRIKKYERIHTQGSKHDGLFELRVQNLPYDKKQELEIILHGFASTIHPSQNTPVSKLDGSNRSRGKQFRGAGSNSNPSSPPYNKCLDSTYASVSATGATFKATSDHSGHSKSRSRNYLPSSVEHEPYTSTCARSQDVESPSLSEISDRSKQKLAVERLEELFLTGDGDVKSIKGNLHPRSPQSRIPRKEATQAASYSQTIKRQTRSSPDQLRSLRRLGVASPVAGSSAESQHEWVYLNLVINLAQLHTLNITPDLVRSGVQAFSTKLVLSDNGSKVRWQGNDERSAESSDDPNDIALTHHVPSATSLNQPEPTIQLPKSQALLQEHNTPGPRNGQSLERVDNLQTFAAGQGTAKRLNYKPLFVHHRHHPRESSRESSDVSQDSGSSLADATESISSDLGDSANAANGPLVFFDGDAFFLDLSSDPTDADSAGHSSYASHFTEPLGRTNGPYKTTHAYERKQAIPILGRENNEDWTRCPPLLVNDNNPKSTSDDAGSGSGNRFQFQASGIGGIQLDDNFAIDVTTSRQPVSHPYHQPRSSTPSFDDGNPTSSSRPLNHPTRQPRTPSTHIVSTQTTQLPPSPLPPPSYVYPALSSTSSDTDDGYGSLDDDLASASGYELRKVSLSPQVRMWVQEQQSVGRSDPLRGGAWSEHSVRDHDGDDDRSMEDDQGSRLSFLAVLSASVTSWWMI